MNHALLLLGWNLCLSVPFAILAWCLCRVHFVRVRPALCHGIWLLVLLKLVTPPLFPVPVLPSSADLGAGGFVLPASEPNHRIELTGGAIGADRDSTDAVPAFLQGDLAAIADLQRIPSIDAANPPAAQTWHEAIIGCLAVSLLITLAVWLVALRQLQRVRRLLREELENPVHISQLLHEVSQSFPFRATPKLAIVDAAIAPVIWGEPGRPSIILSRQLTATLDDDQLRHIIAHELAHYARRDHWTNVFGFLVTTLFWWHPVAWWARREMSLAAESCCDAMVLEQFAGSRALYARTLLTVVDFVQSGNLQRPVLAMTFGGSSSLRRRFQMLANEGVQSRVSYGGWGLLAIGALTLMLLPARAQEAQRSPTTKVSAATKDAVAGESEPASKPDTEKANPTTPNGKYYVTGSVFDEETRKPIAEASLRFLILGPNRRTEIVATDAEGRYRLEVPLGSVRLWTPELKPGYWLEHTKAIQPLATTPDKPVATLDIAAKRGPIWPVQVTVDNGIPEGGQLIVSIMEIADDATRKKMVNREPVSFQTSPASALTSLDKEGRGAVTQCGTSGKLFVGIGMTGDSAQEVMGMSAEIHADPAFDNTQVKSVAPVPGTSSSWVELVDARGAKARISNARAVTVTDGRPLVSYQLHRQKLVKQEFAGLLIDAAGKPVRDVRVGAAVGHIDGGSGESPVSTMSDAEGRFRLQLPLDPFFAEGKQFLNLVFNKDGYAGFDSRNIPLRKLSGAAIELGKFTLQVGRSLPIRVVDARDRPLVGAVVEPMSDYALRRLSIRTDAEGRGTLRNLPAGVVEVQVSLADQVENLKLVVSSTDADNTETKLRIKSAAAPPVVNDNARLTEPIAIGKNAPELTIEKWTDGTEHRLADYRGKVVVLDFWGTWCRGCVTNIPMLQELADKYEARGVVFLGIHTPEGDFEQINKLRKLKSWKAATGVDRGTTTTDGASAAGYGVHGYPTIIVIDAAGKVAFNSSIPPKDMAGFMKGMQQLAVSLQIPWPLPEGDEEKSIAYMNRLMGAYLSREIDRVIAAGGK